ncbi:MAG: alpha-amylase family glycosyl hydrolase, partial [bacterium]|nr:alpha-amylase family glycosyl hydrolase [bacterium]
MYKTAKKLISLFLIVSIGFSCFMLNVQAVETDEDFSGTATYLYGDADKDNEITVMDATTIQLYLTKMQSFDEVSTHISDVDMSGDVDINDVTQIQKFIANLMDVFPSGEYYTVGDTDWRTSTISYEIFVRSFCDSDGDGIGDFRGIASKASYLKELNVGCVWLMPIHESPSYHGYDVIDYYSTNEDYGTIDDFKYMLDVLHRYDIKVLIDFVANHTSSQNSWFLDALSNPDSPYADYYEFTDEPDSTSGWRYNEKYDKYYRGNFSEG